MTRESALAAKPIEGQILLIRGQKVILDADLAALYGVEVRALNQAVKRNENRFPSDFVFQLTAEENEVLKSQTVTSKSSRGGRRYTPYAFTEHGAIMAASVLNSPRAVEMSIFVVRAFLRLRETLATHKALAVKLAELERRLETHDQSTRSSGRSMSSRCRRRSPCGRSASAPMPSPSRRFWRPATASAKNAGWLNDAAVSLCRDNDMPMMVFSMREAGNIVRVVQGEPLGSLVTP